MRLVERHNILTGTCDGRRAHARDSTPMVDIPLYDAQADGAVLNCKRWATRSLVALMSRGWLFVGRRTTGRRFRRCSWRDGRAEITSAVWCAPIRCGGSLARACGEELQLRDLRCAARQDCGAALKSRWAARLLEPPDEVVEGRHSNSGRNASNDETACAVKVSSKSDAWLPQAGPSVGGM